MRLAASTSRLLRRPFLIQPIKYIAILLMFLLFDFSATAIEVGVLPLNCLLMSCWTFIFFQSNHLLFPLLHFLLFTFVVVAADYVGRFLNNSLLAIKMLIVATVSGPRHSPATNFTLLMLLLRRQLLLLLLSAKALLRCIIISSWYCSDFMSSWRRSSRYVRIKVE